MYTLEQFEKIGKNPVVFFNEEGNKILIELRKINDIIAGIALCLETLHKDNEEARKYDGDPYVKERISRSYIEYEPKIKPIGGSDSLYFLLDKIAERLKLFCRHSKMSHLDQSNRAIASDIYTRIVELKKEILCTNVEELVLMPIRLYC